MKSHYRIHDVSSGLEAAVTDLKGLWKTQSIVYLSILSLPVLDGIIVMKPDELSKAALMQLAKKYEWNSFLLRHDKKPETPSYPMGGYLVELKDIEAEVKKYFDMGRIVILLEPCSPYNNSHNINILFENAEIINLEIVGPGFDASDLQRGHISPHEIIKIDGTLLKNNIDDLEYAIEQFAKRTYLVKKEKYEESVNRRYLKIAKRIISLGQGFLEENGSSMAMVAFAKRYLEAMHFDTLIRNENNYSPLSKIHLVELCKYIGTFPDKIGRYTGFEFPYVLSCSYVNGGVKLNFWDIVRPRLKYEFQGSPFAHHN